MKILNKWLWSRFDEIWRCISSKIQWFDWNLGVFLRFFLVSQKKNIYLAVLKLIYVYSIHLCVSDRVEIFFTFEKKTLDWGRTNKIIFKVSVWSDAQHCSSWTRNFWTISFPPLVRNIEKWHISSLSTFRHFCGKRKHCFSELPQSLIGSWLLSQPYMFHVFGKNFSTESKY